MKISLQASISMENSNLASIIREIVRLTDPEKIFLLSASYNYRLRENIFIKNPVQEFSYGQYDLLVLSEVAEKESLAEKEIMLISKLINFRNLQLHLMDIHSFNKGVKAGNEFENYILLNAILSYDKGLVQLENPKMNA